MVNPFRFEDAHDRLAAARVAVARLAAMLPAGASAIVLSHTIEDLGEAARLFEEANRTFIKLENLLTIIEWQIERSLPLR